jgi:hypothetical protein
MKIVNRTHWRTDQLRAIVTRVAADELDAAKRQRMTVYVVYNRAGKRGGWSSGCAHIHGNYIKVRVSSSTVDPIDFAMVTAHEFAHARGLYHRDLGMFKNPHYHRLGEATRTIYAWALEMPIETKLKRTKPTTEEVYDKKYLHVVKTADQWRRRVKLSNTKLKQWTRKQRYYEKKMAALRAAKLEGRE